MAYDIFGQSPTFTVGCKKNYINGKIIIIRLVPVFIYFYNLNWLINIKRLNYKLIRFKFIVSNSGNKKY